MASSIAEEGCPSFELKGGYNVQPVPAPPSTIVDTTIKVRDDGKSQKERLFIRGKDISGALIIKGRNQFPNPPIKTGITIKKIIRSA